MEPSTRLEADLKVNTAILVSGLHPLTRMGTTYLILLLVHDTVNYEVGSSDLFHDII